MTAKLSQSEINAKLANFRTLFIASPFLGAVLDELNECRELSKLGGAPECILITGDSGSGKTSLIETYQKHNLKKESYETTLIPVLCTEVPEKASPVALFHKILVDLKHPYPFESNNEVELREQIKVLVCSCKIELIILDEFQHLMERKSLKILKETANSIKSLIVDTKVPMAIFGMPYSSIILDSVSQLSNRFERRRVIEPFRMSNNDELKTYLTFLSMLEDEMNLPEPSNLASGEMAYRLYAYSHGNFRRLKNLLNDVYKASLEKGELHVSSQRLAEVALSRNKDFTKSTNPFSLPLSNVKITEPGEYVGWDDYNHGKGINVHFKDKPKVLSFSDVF